MLANFILYTCACAMGVVGIFMLPGSDDYHAGLSLVWCAYCMLKSVKL